jgi:hypothetical protein
VAAYLQGFWTIHREKRRKEKKKRSTTAAPTAATAEPQVKE